MPVLGVVKGLAHRPAGLRDQPAPQGQVGDGVHAQANHGLAGRHYRPPATQRRRVGQLDGPAQQRGVRFQNRGDFLHAAAFAARQTKQGQRHSRRGRQTIGGFELIKPRANTRSNHLALSPNARVRPGDNAPCFLHRSGLRELAENRLRKLACRLKRNRPHGFTAWGTQTHKSECVDYSSFAF